MIFSGGYSLEIQPKTRRVMNLRFTMAAGSSEKLTKKKPRFADGEKKIKWFSRFFLLRMRIEFRKYTGSGAFETIICERKKKSCNRNESEGGTK